MKGKDMLSVLRWPEIVIHLSLRDRGIVVLEHEGSVSVPRIDDTAAFAAIVGQEALLATLAILDVDTGATPPKEENMEKQPPTVTARVTSWRRETREGPRWTELEWPADVERPQVGDEVSVGPGPEAVAEWLRDQSRAQERIVKAARELVELWDRVGGRHHLAPQAVALWDAVKGFALPVAPSDDPPAEKGPETMQTYEERLTYADLIGLEYGKLVDANVGNGASNGRLVDLAVMSADMILER